MFESDVDSQNGQSCFGPNLLNATHTSTWTKKHTNTNIPGTTQAVLVLSINVDTLLADGPSELHLDSVCVCLGTVQYQPSCLRLLRL